VDRETVERRRRVLGLENRETLNAMNSLAGVLQDQGKYAEAVALQQQTLELSRKVEGPDAQFVIHPISILIFLWVKRISLATCSTSTPKGDTPDKCGQNSQ